MSARYPDPTVRMRLTECPGGDPLEKATAIHVMHADGCLFQRGAASGRRHR